MSDLNDENRTFKKFSERLLFVIGDIPFTRWAKQHDLSPSTVNEWINHDRLPRDSVFKKLIDVTGIPEDWWLHGRYPYSKERRAPEEAIEHKLYSAEPLVKPLQTLDDFVFVPRYDVRGSASYGSIVHSEQIVDHLVFRKDWVRKTLGVTEKDLVLISVKGDCMEPTLSNDDLILVNIREGRIEDNAVYVLQCDGDLLVQRIQRKMDGTVIIKSDNPLYESEVIDSSKAESLRVLGRVVWYGRKM